MNLKSKITKKKVGSNLNEDEKIFEKKLRSRRI